MLVHESFSSRLQWYISRYHEIILWCHVVQFKGSPLENVYLKLHPWKRHEFSGVSGVSPLGKLTVRSSEISENQKRSTVQRSVCVYATLEGSNFRFSVRFKVLLPGSIAFGPWLWRRFNSGAKSSVKDTGTCRSPTWPHLSGTVWLAAL